MLAAAPAGRLRPCFDCCIQRRQQQVDESRRGMAGSYSLREPRLSNKHRSVHCLHAPAAARVSALELLVCRQKTIMTVGRVNPVGYLMHRMQSSRLCACVPQQHNVAHRLRCHCPSHWRVCCQCGAKNAERRRLWQTVEQAVPSQASQSLHAANAAVTFVAWSRHCAHQGSRRLTDKEGAGQQAVPPLSESHLREWPAYLHAVCTHVHQCRDCTTTRQRNERGNCRATAST